MIAAQQSAEDLGGVNTAPVVLFANGVGIGFRNDNPIASNTALLDVLKDMSQEDIMIKDGETHFILDHTQLGFFLHLAYCHAKEENKIVVELDGIYPFKPDDGQHYNAQLITISECMAQ